MIKKFAKLQVTDSGNILCSKCGKILAQVTLDNFRPQNGATYDWMLQLADIHFKRQICATVMKDAKAKLDIVQGHSPDATLDDVYQLLI